MTMVLVSSILVLTVVRCAVLTGRIGEGGIWKPFSTNSENIQKSENRFGRRFWESRVGWFRAGYCLSDLGRGSIPTSSGAINWRRRRINFTGGVIWKKMCIKVVSISCELDLRI